MKKKTMLWIILDSVFILVFNLLFFTLGKPPHPASVWIAYGFIHFAYFTVLAVPLLCGKEEAAVSRLALYAVSVGYFVIELVIGLLIMLISPARVTASLVIQILIAAVYVAVLAINLLADGHTAGHSN